MRSMLQLWTFAAAVACGAALLTVWLLPDLRLAEGQSEANPEWQRWNALTPLEQQEYANDYRELQFTPDGVQALRVAGQINALPRPQQSQLRLIRSYVTDFQQGLSESEQLKLRGSDPRSRGVLLYELFRRAKPDVIEQLRRRCEMLGGALNAARPHPDK